MSVAKQTHLIPLRSHHPPHHAQFFVSQSSAINHGVEGIDGAARCHVPDGRRLGRREVRGRSRFPANLFSLRRPWLMVCGLSATHFHAHWPERRRTSRFAGNFGQRITLLSRPLPRSCPSLCARAAAAPRSSPPPTVRATPRRIPLSRPFASAMSSHSPWFCLRCPCRVWRREDGRRRGDERRRLQEPTGDADEGEQLKRVGRQRRHSILSPRVVACVALRTRADRAV